jgi:hypothetical protein
MKQVLKQAAVLLLIASTALAQTSATDASSSTPAPKKASKSKRTSAAPKPVYATQQDLQMLRDALAQQQQLMTQMQQQMQQRDAQLQQTEQQLAEAQSVAKDAQAKVAAVETASTAQATDVSQLKSDVSDVKLNMTNAATSTQEDQKRVGTLESTLGRFRFNGDVRVRGEDFFQDRVADRYRPRVRLRLGVEGKLNEDFIAGIYLASGTLTDPTSTNETLTNAFQKKTIGFDRGYITYNPVAHKWLSLTGGKFAFTWQRTNLTFDPDINPEGFSEKFSFDLKSPFLKNVTFTGLQLSINESGGGNDSYAVGGQVSSKLQLGSLWTMTPSYTVLNFRNEVALLRGAIAGSAPTGTSLGGPITTGVFAPNGLTNQICGTGAAPVFCSRFLYSDLILVNQIKTPWAKFPVNITGEYLTNLNAASNRSHLYYGELSVGQTRNKGDFQIGYAFNRQEQDSTISSFVESDQRSPTNIVQNRIFFAWKVKPNTTLGYTQWIGRTLDCSLQNARCVQTLPATPAAQLRDPWLKRGQLDLIYTF